MHLRIIKIIEFNCVLIVTTKKILTLCKYVIILIFPPLFLKSERMSGTNIVIKREDCLQCRTASTVTRSVDLLIKLTLVYWWRDMVCCS